MAKVWLPADAWAKSKRMPANLKARIAKGSKKRVVSPKKSMGVKRK